MRDIYLSSKQILFLASPFFILALLYSFPRYSAALVDSIGELASKASLYNFDNYEELVKEGFEKGYYKHSEVIIQNFDNHEQSIYSQDPLITSWIIAYLYKELPEDAFLGEKDGNSSKIIRLKELYRIVDQRNKDIKTNLAIEGIGVKAKEIQRIQEIIKSRNLDPLMSEKMKRRMLQQNIELDLSKYKLQMILWGSKSPTVIINNKVYTKAQEIDLNTKIKQIKQNKVLLQNLKEEKWLHLNK